MSKVVIAIIENSDNILLSKVKQDKLNEFGGLEYVFPGGRVEDNETLPDAVVREVREETGLVVEVIGQVSFRVHPVTSEEIYYYHCKCLDFDSQGIPQTNDIESLHWVSIFDLEEFVDDLNPDIRRYLQVI